VVRADGRPTYLASDIAYHLNKYDRDFEKVIDVWGADHHGYVPRVRAALQMAGRDPESFKVVLVQFVSLKRGGEQVSMSTRAGKFVQLSEVMREVGVDSSRFFFLMRNADAPLEFDLELAKEESSENPVYYVQYAYARISSILRLAQERGLDYTCGDVALLTHEAEEALIKKMCLLPELIESMAQSLEPHHLPRYAIELATAFHWFYQECRVVSGEPGDEAITLARLKLVKACRIVLARCLSLMSMSAPERM